MELHLISEIRKKFPIPEHLPQFEISPIEGRAGKRTSGESPRSRLPVWGSLYAARFGTHPFATSCFELLSGKR